MSGSFTYGKWWLRDALKSVDLDLSMPVMTESKCANQSVLVDSDLTPDAYRFGQAAAMSLIDPIVRRSTAVFLGTDNYQGVESVHTEIMDHLMLQCLPAFVHDQNGQIAFVTNHDRSGIVAPAMRTAETEERTLQFLHEGIVYICFNDEQVVVSSEGARPGTELLLTVRSNKSAATFFEKWQMYARHNNYLMGQAFFPDGTIIKRNPDYNWENIILPDRIRKTIEVHVEGFLRSYQKLRRLGVKGRRGILLAGEPGTGKTLLGKVLANILNVSFLWVTHRHIAESQSFETIMSLARFVAPTVVFLEDLDLFAEDRDIHGWSGLGELMNQLDGVVDNTGVITIASTNRLQVVEKALRNRPGRFDRIIEFEVMDDVCRRKLITRLMNKATAEAEDLDHLVATTAGYTGAEIEELVNTIYLMAVDNNGSTAKLQETQAECLTVDRKLIDAAASETAFEKKRPLGFHVA